MDSIELKLCDIQGRLFELAWKEHYNSERFIRYKGGPGVRLGV